MKIGVLNSFFQTTFTDPCDVQDFFLVMIFISSLKDAQGCKIPEYPHAARQPLVQPLHIWIQEFYNFSWFLIIFSSEPAVSWMVLFYDEFTSLLVIFITFMFFVFFLCLLCFLALAEEQWGQIEKQKKDKQHWRIQRKFHPSTISQHCTVTQITYQRRALQNQQRLQD